MYLIVDVPWNTETVKHVLMVIIYPLISIPLNVPVFLFVWDSAFQHNYYSHICRDQKELSHGWGPASTKVDGEMIKASHILHTL